MHAGDKTRDEASVMTKRPRFMEEMHSTLKLQIMMRAVRETHLAMLSSTSEKGKKRGRKLAFSMNHPMSPPFR